MQQLYIIGKIAGDIRNTEINPELLLNHTNKFVSKEYKNECPVAVLRSGNGTGVSTKLLYVEPG